MITNEELMVMEARVDGRTPIKDEDRLKELREDVSRLIGEVNRLKRCLTVIHEAVEEADIPCDEESKNIYYKRLYGAKDVDIPFGKKTKDAYYEWMYGTKEEK